MDTTYRIPDEPRPGALARFAVNPFWPLFGIMLAGAWLAWPWFVFNAWAVGSPTRLRETALAVVGLLGAAALGFGLLAAQGAGLLDNRALQYALLAMPVFKIGVCYLLYVWQTRTFELYEYYGGRVINGLPILILGIWFGRKAVLSAVPGAWWKLVMG